MTMLQWDQAGERKFHNGVDRGVLYLPDVITVWNGLTGVEESSNVKSQPYYQDGTKYMDQQILGDFSGTLKAFTYPEQFERCLGIQDNGGGVLFHDQQAESFGLSYRTLIGDDISGLEHGYIIHVLYNLKAISSSDSYSSVGGSISPMEFSWALTSTPEIVPYIRPTAHISLRSTDFSPDRLQDFEDALYGSPNNEPYLPTMQELANA